MSWGKVRPLILSTLDEPVGAARAASRLLHGLEAIGVPAKILVQEKLGRHESVLGPDGVFETAMARVSPKLDKLLSRSFRRRRGDLLSFGISGCVSPRRVAALNPDVINLHWVNRGFVRPETIPRLGKPIVWTLHDMWPFTGGCHYDGGCGRYSVGCGQCPALGSRKLNDPSSWLLNRKRKAWHGLRMRIVTPSRWLARCAAQSALFKDYPIEAIPNGIDLGRFRPVDKRAARKELGLPLDRKLILFGADGIGDPRKGFSRLREALDRLREADSATNCDLVTFGHGSLEGDRRASLGFRTHSLGQIASEDRLALVYAASDVCVAPSVQDNLPNIVVEALACGTPCVAFDVGGMGDMIETGVTGYLARPFDPGDLAKGIAWVTENDERHRALSRGAREKAEREFSMELQARRYLLIYEKALTQRLRLRNA